MKKLSVVFIVLLLFLYGCGGGEPADIADTPSPSEAPSAVDAQEKPSAPAAEPPAEPETPPSQPAPSMVAAEETVGEEMPELPSRSAATEEKEEVEAAEEEQADVDPALKPILSLSEKKVKNYAYVYDEPPLNTGGDTWFVHEDKIKIKLQRTNLLMATYDFNYVYLDTASQKAIGYCLEDALRCPEGMIKYDADYDFWNRKTPHEWLAGVSSAEKKGSKSIGDRNVQGVKTVINNRDTILWLDEFYGLPVKIDILEGEDVIETFNFVDIQFNSFKEDDVTPPDGYE